MTNQSVIKKRHRRPDARPSEILDAALLLFSEKGFAATRMDDVAAKSGMSKGTLYLYFPDKAAILTALLEATAGSAIETVASAVAAHQGPVAPLISLLLGFLAEQLDTTNLASVIKLILAESRAHPEIGKAYLQNVIGKAVPVMEGLISRGIATGEFRATDVGLTVRSLIAPMLLAAMWKSIFEPLGAEPLSARALAAHHAQLILQALKP